MPAPNLLAISVGNTRTRIGAFVAGKLEAVATHDNARPDRLEDALNQAHSRFSDTDPEDLHLLLSSVNPEQGEQVQQLVHRKLNRDIFRVEKDLPIPIGRQLDREALVGEDRLLNAAAAFDALKQACVVVDAGTAITVDFVDGAGTFHGGAIAPGAQLMLDALTQRTAQLPDVEFKKPEETIGHNTTEAMLVGTYHGLRGMVHELTETFAEHVGQFPLVVATGGDGDLLFRDDPRVDRVVPDLTLLGMFVTLRTALEQPADDQS